MVFPIIHKPQLMILNGQTVLNLDLSLKASKTASLCFHSAVSSYNNTQFLDSLLEIATRLSATCCERLVEGQGVPVIFTLIKNCNRSLPSKQIIKYCVDILLNLTKVCCHVPCRLYRRQLCIKILTRQRRDQGPIS